jgi:RNA polymerase sigma-70 factor (ECF subfamily)
MVSGSLPPLVAATGASLDDAQLQRLLRACAAGSRSDLERLYRACAPRLLGQLVVLLSDRAQAEDALQEVFIKVWERAAQYDAARGRPLTWMLSIARNHAIDQLRARRVSVPIDDDTLQLAAAEPDWSSLESEATAANLARCLQLLQAEQRQCLRLAYAGGYSQEQIAAAMGSPLGSVKSWVRRALRSLHECLGP